MKNSIPEVGTLIEIQPDMISMSRDRQTPVCRIKYDGKRWNMVAWGPQTGMLVFLKTRPTEQHKFIRITAIQPTGKAAYADPASV
jgi:hypothetical protein